MPLCKRIKHTSVAGAANEMVIGNTPLYFALFTRRVTSDPSGFVTVVGIDSGFARYLSQHNRISVGVAVEKSKRGID